MNDRKSDPPLKSVMKEELSTTGELIAVINQNRDIFPGGGCKKIPSDLWNKVKRFQLTQLEDFKPYDKVVLGVQVTCGWTSCCSELAAPDRL